MSATVRGWLQVWPCPRSSGPSYAARRTWCGGRNPARGTAANASLTASTPSSQPRFGGRGKNIDVRAAYSG